MKTCATVLAMIGLFASTAQAVTLTRVVVAGGKLELGGVSSINVDCTVHGYPEIRVTNSPQHGAVTTRKGLVFEYFSANHPLHDCNRRKVSGVYVDYRPERGFTGTDYFTVDMIFPSGLERSVDYEVIVK